MVLEIELQNGCSETGCVVKSDSNAITDFVRRHYLLNFGHRDIEKIVADYAPDAVIHSVVNGHHSVSRGSSEIARAFEEIFRLHPTQDSTFQLKQIVVEAGAKQAMAIWSAETPSMVFKHGQDNFVFDNKGKIVSQMYVASTEQKEDQDDDAFAMGILD